MKNSYFHSRYNYFIERQEGTLAYNARTGTFALLTPDTAQILQNKDEVYKIVNPEKLVDMGFLHKGNELEDIINQYEAIKNTDKIAHITILPTLSCNFSCNYCFQSEYRKHEHMSEEVQEKTLRFIEHLIATGRSEIILTWFGGEPLLAKNTILKLSRELNSLARSYNANIRKITIITNGILLKPSIAKELASVGVRSAQISIDALTFVSTKKRGVIDEFGHPSIILSNILKAQEYLDINIRINVSSANKDDIPRIVDTLDENGLLGRYSFARVHDHEAENNFITTSNGKRLADCNSCNSCDSATSESMNHFRYSLIERDLMNKNTAETLQQIVQRLQPKSHFCSATSGRMFVVDPEGYVSRCWHSAGCPSEAMGSVNDTPEIIAQSGIAQSWRNFSPFAYHECNNCKVLPLCMGGCSHSRMFMEATKPPCESIKYQIQEYVNKIGKIIEIKQEQKDLVSTKEDVSYAGNI